MYSIEVIHKDKRAKNKHLVVVYEGSRKLEAKEFVSIKQAVKWAKKKGRALAKLSNKSVRVEVNYPDKVEVDKVKPNAKKKGKRKTIKLSLRMPKKMYPLADRKLPFVGGDEVWLGRKRGRRS